MRHFTKVVLVMFCVSKAMSQDTVPHNFEPGTPAKAAEVNANFQTVMQKANEADAKADTNASELVKVKQDVATLDRGGSPGLEAVESDIESLDSRVTELDDRVDVLHNGGVGGVGTSYVDPWPITFTYTERAAELGSTVKFSEEDKGHKIIKVPFIDFHSGEQYTIQLPAALGEDGKFHENIDCIPFALGLIMTGDIDPYPVRLICEARRTISISESSLSAFARLEIYATLGIKVGNSYVSFNISLPQYIVVNGAGRKEQEVSIKAAGHTDYCDITKNLSYDPMVAGYKQAVEDYLDDYIDYIKIEKNEQVSE